MIKINALELRKLLAVMEARGFSIPEVISLIRKNISQQEKNESTDKLVFVVDYSKTVPEMIKLGRYDWKNSGVSKKNFPKLNKSSDKIKLSGKLFSLEWGISRKKAISKMKKLGYRPATFFELLFLGYLFPNLQRLFPIVALASVWDDEHGAHSIPYLDANGDWRGLSLSYLFDDWEGKFHFLGIKI